MEVRLLLILLKKRKKQAPEDQKSNISKESLFIKKSIMKNVGTEKNSISALREELAELEHIQWAHWTEYMLSNLTPENIERWQKQCSTDYSDLSEQEKESDREWANKVLSIFLSFRN